MDALFLTLNELPQDESIDLNFYRTADGYYFSPRRHWCLVGQIVSVETFLRLRLVVRDRDGVQFQIAIHTEDRGSNFPSNLLVPGYTVAILYAHQHGFLDFTTGIRQEEKQTLRIFGTDLETFYRLQSSIKARNHTGSTCHGCGSITDAKMRCAKCTLVAYCNRSCQEKGWTQLNHKLECKILRDRDFRLLSELDWVVFEDYKIFEVSV